MSTRVQKETSLEGVISEDFGPGMERWDPCSIRGKNFLGSAGWQPAVSPTGRRQPHQSRIATASLPLFRSLPPIRPHNSVNFVNSVQINHPILRIPRERELVCVPCETHRVNDELRMKKANTASEAGTPCRGTRPSAFIVTSSASRRLSGLERGCQALYGIKINK